MTILQAINISVSFHKKQILDTISFTSEKPELIGLVGPNGAGKTTLLRALIGQQSLQNGEVTISGQPLRSLSSPKRARLLAYLPQNRNLHWPLVVEDVVMLGRHPYRSGFAAPSAKDIACVRNAMAQMDIEAFASRPFRMLSGGEQARVLIARALAQQTNLLLADEPLAGLDPAHQISLMQCFQRIVREGRTVILSLHELTLAARWCDRLLLLQKGILTKDGVPGTVLEADALKSAFGVGGYISVHSNKPLIVPLELEEGKPNDR